ncbi:transglutaminase family protein [Sphingomonas bacterium]|uniref:transglutaminase family protein n=1 Tax=Sphingomonas bacterium TaxID=1895847 RepID=UPI00260A0896|nr:transglutaminase family protein [Sphingomonas bacterium]MDB5680073.1 transglutaminase [Sphingomonas bacterium]
MRIAVDHTLTVAFPSLQSRATLALRVTPDDHHDQTVSGWRIGPDCDARLRNGRDGYGNVLTMVYAEGPIDGIEFHVTGEVFTGPSSGILSPAHPEPLPPSLFLRPGDATASDLVALVVDAGEGAADAIERLHHVNVALHRRADDAGRDALTTSFVAAARRLAYPARCVSGYLVAEGGSRPHVWAEAHVAGIGWVGFDPLLGLSAGEDHARVASALDLAGVAMIVGI